MSIRTILGLLLLFISIFLTYRLGDYLTPYLIHEMYSYPRVAIVFFVFVLCIAGLTKSIDILTTRGFTKIFWMDFLLPSLVILYIFFIYLFNSIRVYFHLIELPLFAYVIYKIEKYNKNNEFVITDYIYIGFMILISGLLVSLPIIFYEISF